MAKHDKDTRTAELPGLPPLPKKLGRPVTGAAKSPAERMAASRARKSADLDRITLKSSQIMAHVICSLSEIEDGDIPAARELLGEIQQDVRDVFEYLKSLRPDYYLIAEKTRR